MLTQNHQDLAAQDKAYLEHLAKSFAPGCIPTNWEKDHHPAYEGLDPQIRDFVRKRYRHWAPKVTWIFRVWYHLTRMHAHLSAEWLARTKDNTDAEVKAYRRTRAVEYFWDGCFVPASPPNPCI